MNPLAGRHAVVTGANRGIGAAIARHLAGAGADVALLVRSPASAEPLAMELSRLGVVCPIVAADVSDGAAVRRACAAADRALGGVDILVNNAGIAETAGFLKTDPAVFAQMITLHLMGPVHAIQSVLPAMLERKSGRIVNVASIAGLRGAPYIAAYAAAKHAMVGLTRALAAEYGGTGVLVNAVCPGYTDTEMVSTAVARIVAKTGRSHAEALQLILADSGQRRLVTVDEVAAAVLAFCLPGDARSGETLLLMGEEVA